MRQSRKPRMRERESQPAARAKWSLSSRPQFLKKTSPPSAAHQKTTLPPHVTQISDSAQLVRRSRYTPSQYRQVFRPPRHSRSVGVNISHDQSTTRLIPSSCTAFCGISRLEDRRSRARQSCIDRPSATFGKAYREMVCRPSKKRASVFADARSRSLSIGVLTKSRALVARPAAFPARLRI